MFRRIWMQQDYTRKVSGRKWHDITNVNGQLKGKGKKALKRAKRQVHMSVHYKNTVFRLIYSKS